jgi:hypothetical protein
MEIAAMLLLAEAKRHARGLLGTTSARISFVSKLYYPLWAVLWGSQSLIIDGLGVSKSTYAVTGLPNVQKFIEDVERGSSVRALFRNALEKHVKTFDVFAQSVEVQIDALITDKDALAALFEYSKDLSPTGSSHVQIALAPPELSVDAAVEAAKQVQSLYARIQSDTAALDYSRNLLEETFKLHEQMVLKEINVKREAYGEQIGELKPEAEKKVDKLLTERDTRLGKMGKRTDGELKSRIGEKEKRERELQKLMLAKADFVRKREARSHKHDKIGEAHWAHQVRTADNRMAELNARIRSLAEFIEKTRKQSEEDTEKLRQGYQWLIDQEQRKIVDIEIQRDQAIEAKQREIEAMKSLTLQIATKIDGLVKRKEEEANQLKELAHVSQFDETTLLCLPFYLVCHKTHKTTRFRVFSPVTVVGLNGVVGAIRRRLGALGAVTAVEHVLQPKSKALTRMLESVIKEKMKSDKEFSADLIEVAASNNVLLKDNIKETLTKGTAELRAAGWINTKDEKALLNAYTSRG